MTMDSSIPDLLDRILIDLEHLEPGHGAKLQAGLTDQQIDNLTAPLGLSMPAEVRALYNWHNGFRQGAPNRLYPSTEFLPLADVVAETLELRQGSEDIRPDIGFDVFREGWLATFHQTGGDVLVCSCEGPDVAPVYNYIVAEADPDPMPYSNSLAQLLAYWVDAYESGGIAMVDGVLVANADVPPGPR